MQNCESQITPGECYAAYYLNDWDNLCDETTGCKYPGFKGEYSDAIEVEYVIVSDQEGLES